MNTRKCHFDEAGYYRWGVQVADPPDFETVFPTLDVPKDEKRDKYGNLRYRLVANSSYGKQMDEGVDGSVVYEDTRRYLGMELAEQAPTEDQIKVVQDLEIAARITLEYPIDEQIAELRKAAAQAGYPVSFEERAEEIKARVRDGK